MLEREIETEDGACRIVDFMPRRSGDAAHVVRIVEGLRGQVRVRSELIPRFDYGEAIPWIEQTADGMSAAVGPDALLLRTPVGWKSRMRASSRNSRSRLARLCRLFWPGIRRTCRRPR